MKKLSIFVILLSIVISVNAQGSADIIENAISSVVTVGVYKNSYAKNVLGYRGEKIADEAYKAALDLSGCRSSGSGFLINYKGKKYVITNAHVVESASEESGSIYVYSIKREKYEVKVLGGDSFYDIAVLEFVDQPGNEITTISFKSDEVRLGEPVYAIGNPLGEYPYTVTDGIISAKNRMRGGTTGKFGFLQSTATVIWGNSGGPLIDTKGQVVGINSQIAFASTPDGGSVWQSQINFALESGISQRLIKDIIENDGMVKRAYLGLEVKESYEYHSDYYGDWFEQIDDQPVLSAHTNLCPSAGIVTTYLGSPILEVNGVDVRNIEEVLGEFEKIQPGSSYTLTLLYNGTSKTITLKSTELEEQHLIEAARFFLESNANFNPDYNSPYARFSMTANDGIKNHKQSLNYKEGLNQKKQYQQMQQEKSGVYYTVLAAGVAGDEYANMWMIQDLKDFGISIRLSALEGVIDFYAQPENSYDDDNIESYRIFLSGNENILQKTVWY